MIRIILFLTNGIVNWRKILEKAVVLVANNDYAERMLTTIKSVIAHNRGIDFYIINDDIPVEWFQLQNKHLKFFQSQVINIKIANHRLGDYHLPHDALHYASFFYYYMADYIQADRALYLDCDIIVRENLDDLFTLDFEDNYIAAVQDIYLDGQMLPNFNSGVVLANLEKWRQETVPMSQQLLELTNQHHKEAYGDQGILNMRFDGQWKHLDGRYNCMLGVDSEAFMHGNKEWYENSEQNPIIIHYTGRKPWESYPANRFRNIWWFYNGLSWEDILYRFDLYHEDWENVIDKKQYKITILTETAELMNIDKILTSLPMVQFYIGARCFFAVPAIELQSYGNVILYPSYNPFGFKEMVESMDIYLELGFGGEVDNIISVAGEHNIPVLGFESTCHSSGENIYIFKDDDVDAFITKIKNILKIE